MNKAFSSIAISASAGCGKTEEMALRLLCMFLSSNEPQKIFESTIAMTFSKSGAKEIYGRIIELLFTAVMEKKIDTLYERLRPLAPELPELSEQKLLKLLRTLIFAVNELKICTIDSFMNKIVQSFAAELGLPCKAEIISESESKILNEKVLKKLLISPEHQTFEFDDEEEDIALESKKTAYGRNSRNFMTRISDALDKYERLLDDNPDISCCLPAEFNADDFSISKRIDAWHTLKDTTTPKRMAAPIDKESFYNVMKKIHTADADTHFTKKELKRMRDFYSRWNYLTSGDFNGITGFAKENFTEQEQKAVIMLLKYAAHILLHQNIIRSNSYLNIARKYRQIYSDIFYRQGKLTFNDMPRLLSNEENSWTYDIAYRLNNRFDNYLIDEFQDTSRIQWHVLDSIFGSPSEDEPKSMFIVGDVKQAIYNWRSGDRKLMPIVIDYMKSQIGMTRKSLDVSFRYGQNICNALNLIFDNDLIANAGFFGNSGEIWKNSFSTHRASPLLQYRSKFEAFLYEGGKDSDPCHDFAELILHKIREFNIIERRRSCVILVRKTKEGTALLKELQQHPQYGEFFMWEGNDCIDNNKLISCLLHLLIYIQHPADTMSREIANMLPCIRFLIPRTGASLQRENNILTHDGFYQYLKNCIRKLKARSVGEQISPADTENLELFLAGAEEFDRCSVEKDSRIFKEFISSIKYSEEAVGYKIRIMTAHHSKGLTFDHVFPVFFEGSSVINRQKNIPIVIKNHDGSKGILNAVNEEFSVFENINSAWDQFTSENILEQISLMYVALSRARYTNTLILPKLSADKLKKLNNGQSILKEKSYFLTDYITEILFSGGRKKFMLNSDINFSMIEIDDKNIPLPVFKEKMIQINQLPPVPFVCRKDTAMRRRRIRPSDGLDNSEEDSSKKLFFNLPDESKGKSFGDRLHSILAGIEDFNKPELFPECSESIKNEINKLISNPKIGKLLSDYDECWNERSFDVIVQNCYISGCFDRVQLKYDSSGNIAGAAVIDYKSGIHTDSKNSKTIRYHRQLNTYRMAASKLLSLPIEKIKCFIIWSSDSTLEEVMP